MLSEKKIIETIKTIYRRKLSQLASSPAIEATKMKTGKISSIAVLMFFVLECIGQYIFKDEIKLPCTHVKNQPITGTCWSLPTTSFIETRILKTSKELALSQMMNVRIAYLKKVQNYVMRQWEDQPDLGVLAPGALQVIKNYEMIAQAAYSGLTVEEDTLDLRELNPVLKTFLNEVIIVSHPG